MDAHALNSLRHLAQQFRSGDEAGQLATIERIGLARLFDVRTLVWAVGLGGFEFVGFLAALGAEYTNDAARYQKILTACDAARAVARDPAVDDAQLKTALILEIIQGFRLDDTAESFLLTLQNELAFASGTPNEVLAAAAAEMKRRNWATAAAGFERLLAQVKERAPATVYAQAAECLHHLGRFADAERLSLQGLGPQRELIAQRGTPPPEAVIQRHWPANTAPLVSIVCMTYNHARYIEDTIRGFLTQETSFPFEVLIHDDASTDGTPALIRAWQEKYPGIVRAVLQTENQFSRGVRAFDLLLRQTRGRYVATCEGDDYWIRSDKLQKQVGFLEQHPDFSCAGHSYYLYNESRLSVHCWDHSNVDRIISERQLMNVSRLFWLPTLVFRKTFSVLPPERAAAPIGDQFLTSYLGTQGKGIYFESFLGAVRRENQYSIWTPMADEQKEIIRVKTWLALVRLHERLGHPQAASDLLLRIDASRLDPVRKSELARDSLATRHVQTPPAINE
jgi:glycosyltransferase involved in cell wall biosynthesis